tara:strand:- start:430 stop:660 length:231 start_codon:yes stop_codon:yes gene_type:complete
MVTIFTFASVTQALATVQGGLGTLAYNYKEDAPRTTLDEAHIDLLVASANEMIAAATALKSIAYDPTPEEEEDVTP